MGGEGRPGGGEAFLELRHPLDGGVELGLGLPESEADLPQLLGTQPQLHLELLHLAEQALLLASQARELLLEGRATLLDLEQAFLVGGGVRGLLRRQRKDGEGEEEEGDSQTGGSLYPTPVPP